MDLGTIIGFSVGIVAIFGVACNWEVMAYFDLPSVGLVFGGCLTMLLISVPMDKLRKLPKTYLLAFKNVSYDPEPTIKKFVGFAEVARRDGILSLENVLDSEPDPFLRQGLQMAVDGVDAEVITQVMNTKIDNIERRHEENRQGLEFARGAAPSWGAMGTVIGLVKMVKGGVEDPNALIMGIAVALLTTFYGSLIASWIIGPPTDKLIMRTGDEVLLKNIIVKGVISLQEGDNPRIIEQKLRSFMGGWKKDEDK